MSVATVTTPAASIATRAPEPGTLAAPQSRSTASRQPASAAPPQPRTPECPLNEGALLLDYADHRLSFRELAEKHHIGLFELAAWARKPSVITALKILADAESDRAAHLVALAQARATAALIRAVDAPNPETSRRAASATLRLHKDAKRDTRAQLESGTNTPRPSPRVATTTPSRTPTAALPATPKPQPRHIPGLAGTPAPLPVSSGGLTAPTRPIAPAALTLGDLAQPTATAAA